jgi:hypothetical protein
MPAILNQEWLNSNSGRSYPFEENMNRVPRDGDGVPLTGVVIPNSLVVDMVLTVPASASMNGIRVYLSQLIYTDNLMSLVFRARYDGPPNGFLIEGSNDSLVCGISFDPSTHAANSAYNLVGSGVWEDVRGWINIGDLTMLAQDLPQGSYTFTAADALLEARVVRPALRGVRSLSIENAGNISARLYEHVKLIAGNNIILDYDVDANAIWIHAANNAGYTEDCACESTRDTNIVRTINGVSVADVVIMGDGECVEVTTSGNRIVIKDTCSEPCCGCPELDYLNNNIKILEASLSTLTDYANRLSERITTFVTNFILTQP